LINQVPPNTSFYDLFLKGFGSYKERGEGEISSKRVWSTTIGNVKKIKILKNQGCIEIFCVEGETHSYEDQTDGD
jgi:hypothetical protein